MQRRSFSLSVLLLVTIVFFTACSSPTDSGSSGTTVTVINKMGVSVTLHAGDFSLFLKGGYTAPYHLSLGTLDTPTAFSLPASTEVNLWKETPAGTFTYLADSTGSTIRSFRFSSGVKYTLTLNSGSYSLAEGDSAPVTTPSSPSTTVTSRVFPTTTTSPFSPDVAESVVAKDLIASKGTVLSRRSSSSWTYTFLAEVDYPAADSAKPVSFVKARVDLLDEAGEVLYSTSQLPSGTSKYLDIPAQGRYQISTGGPYTYGNNDLFPGGKAYLCWFLYLPDSKSSTDPLYGLDISKVKGMRLALVASQYLSLGIQPVPADLALVAGSSSVSGTQWQGTFSTPAASTIWWQVSSSSMVLFRDASDRFLDYDFVGLGAGASWLIGPGKSSTFTAKVPTDIQGTAVSAVALMESDVGVPLSASVRALVPARDRDQGREADQEARSQALGALGL